MSSSGIIGLDTNQSGETMVTRSTASSNSSTASRRSSSRSDIITIGGYEYHIGNASEEQIKMLYKLHYNNNGSKAGGTTRDYHNVEVVDMNDEDDDEDQYEDEPTPTSPSNSKKKLSTGIIFGKFYVHGFGSVVVVVE